MSTTIVIFANSVKHAQHCVAGKVFNTNQWVRPVSDPNGKELDHEQAKFKNPYGRYLVKPLQKIKMQFSGHVPLQHQPENYLISDSEWIQNYNISNDEIVNYLDYPENLWGLGNHINANLIKNGALHIEQSLYLVNAQNINLYFNQYQKRRASFNYNDVQYDLPVTDPNFSDIISGQRQHNGYICVSLAEEYQGSHYKIIASIL